MREESAVMPYVASSFDDDSMVAGWMVFIDGAGCSGPDARCAAGARGVGLSTFEIVVGRFEI